MVFTLKQIILADDPVSLLRKLNDDGDIKKLEPTLAALNMNIPSGYHHKNNWEHSLQVLQNAINQDLDNKGDLVLRTAALFHDVGKPVTRQFGTKGNVTFTNHDFVGAKMVQKILFKHGYTKNDVKEIATLVRLHMRSHTFKFGWTESAVRRLITNAGSQKQLERLIIIFYSDATTKIDKKKIAISVNVSALAVELARIKEKDKRNALRPALNGFEVASFLNIKPGSELGKVMKFLNSDENIHLTKNEVLALLKNHFL